MKIVCICDMAITQKVMAPMKELEQYGAEVVFLDDSQMQTPKAITEVMLKTEQGGADASPANPDVIEACKDADIIVAHASPINTEVLSEAKKVKCIGISRSGIENLKEDLCKERGIRVISAPTRSVEAVADCAVALMLVENKNIARGHRCLMEGKWVKQFANFMYTHDMRKCTVGIIGAGQIGQRVIKRLEGFGSNIIVYDPFMTKEQVEGMGYTYADMQTLFEQSDFVSVHLRLSEKTKHIIGEKELSSMKKTAYFINTARAGLVDEAALVAALQAKTIGGAAIDVFEVEPLPEDSPFLKLDNVTITPHLAGTSIDTFSNSVEIIAEQLDALFKNGEL